MILQIRLRTGGDDKKRQRHPAEEIFNRFLISLPIPAIRAAFQSTLNMQHWRSGSSDSSYILPRSNCFAVFISGLVVKAWSIFHAILFENKWNENMNTNSNIEFPNHICWEGYRSYVKMLSPERMRINDTEWKTLKVFDYTAEISSNFLMII